MTSRELSTLTARRSGMWRSVCWQLFTDVSWQPTVFTFKGQAVQDNLTFEEQGWTNLGSQVAPMNRFCTAAPNTWGSLVWNLPLAATLAARIWWRLIDFWEISVSMLYDMHGDKCTFTEFEISVKVPQATLFMEVTWRQRVFTINLARPIGYCVYRQLLYVPLVTVRTTSYCMYR